MVLVVVVGQGGMDYVLLCCEFVESAHQGHTKGGNKAESELRRIEAGTLGEKKGRK